VNVSPGFDIDQREPPIEFRGSLGSILGLLGQAVQHQLLELVRHTGSPSL
jgi:hypothetical protein